MPFVDVRIDDEGVVRLFGETERRAVNQLQDAMDDIADHIVAEAKRRAPEDTGVLKAHPVERSDARRETRPAFHRFHEPRGTGVVTDIPLFGGGTAIRGARGRFVKGVGIEAPGTIIQHGGGAFLPETVVIRIDISIPEEPEYAKWVHDGTGLYGPHESPIVPTHSNFLVFYIDEQKFVRRSVRGQRPNPYLLHAFEEVNAGYVPGRLAKLQADVL